MIKNLQYMDKEPTPSNGSTGPKLPNKQLDSSHQKPAQISPNKQQPANQAQPPPVNQAQPPPDKVASRKIPETLIQSYDLCTLKEEKKKRFKKEIMEQEEVNESYIENLLQIEGECICCGKQQEETKAVFRLTPSIIVISKLGHIRIRDVQKIKLKADSEGDDRVKKEASWTVKITWAPQGSQRDWQNIFIKISSWIEAYYLFAAIITRKLYIQDFVLHDSSNVRCSESKAVTVVEGDTFIVTYLKISQVSNFFKKWDKKKVRVGEQIEVFKDEKVSSAIKNIKEIWTRFSMHNGYFVVKIHHGLEKTEIGIPLVDFTNVGSPRNWLYLISRLTQ